MGRIQRKKSSVARKKKKVKETAKASIPVKPKADVPAREASVKAASKQRALAPRKPLSIARSTPAQQKSTIISKTVQFLREVKMELKKVTWPSRKQTLGSTLVVIILVTIIAFFLGAVDIGLSSLVRIVLQ